MTRPVAVLLAGAGSSADFVRRAFGPALADHEVVAVPPVPGPSVVDRAVAALDAAAEAYGPRLRLVGGVSLGAHIATRWAARRATPTPRTDPRRPGRRAGGSAAPGGPATPQPGRPASGGPAGSGAPAGSGGPAGRGKVGSGAAGSGGPGGSGGQSRGAGWGWRGGAGAAGVDRAAGRGGGGDRRGGGPGGPARHRRRAGRGPGRGVGWVADELAAAWPAYGDLLAPTLRAAARSAGRRPAELAALACPGRAGRLRRRPAAPAGGRRGVGRAAPPRRPRSCLRLADLGRRPRHSAPPPAPPSPPPTTGRRTLTPPTSALPHPPRHTTPPRTPPQPQPTHGEHDPDVASPAARPHRRGRALPTELCPADSQRMLTGR